MCLAKLWWRLENNCREFHHRKRKIFKLETDIKTPNVLRKIASTESLSLVCCHISEANLPLHNGCALWYVSFTQSPSTVPIQWVLERVGKIMSAFLPTYFLATVLTHNKSSFRYNYAKQLMFSGNFKFQIRILALPS